MVFSAAKSSSEAGCINEAQLIFEKDIYRFNLLLSDVGLPDGNGLSPARTIKAINPQISVIMTSGYIDEKGDIASIHNEGFYFLQKPCNLNVVLQMARESLHRGN